MKKYIFIIIGLLITNILASYYLKDIIQSRKAYCFSYDDIPLFVQSEQINLKSENDFVFNDYFIDLSIGQNMYRSRFNVDENKCIISNKTNIDYLFDYTLIKPEVIKEIETVYVDRFIDNDNNTYFTQSSGIICNQEYFCYQAGTNISTIIQDVSNSVESDSYITCDYSCLNPNISGQYSIVFFNDIDSIQVLVEII